MPKGFGGHLRLELSKTGMTLSALGGTLSSRTTVVVNKPFSGATLGSTERLMAELRLGLSEVKYSHYPVTLILADDWVRLFIVTPPRNATRLEDCKAAAAMRFQEIYDEPVTDWYVEADWDAYGPMLACAIPQGLLTALHQIAAEHRFNLVGIAPHFVAAWNEWREHMQASAWFGVVHDSVLTLGMPDKEFSLRPCAVRATHLPRGSEQDTHWHAQHVAREALRMNLPMPSQTQLCGDVPPQWLTASPGAFICTQLDATKRVSGKPSGFSGIALAPSRRPPIRIDFATSSFQRAILHTHPITWLFGAAGSALCLGAAATTLIIGQGIRAQEVELERVHALQFQRSDHVMQQSLAKPSRIATSQAAAVNLAIAQLNLPWRNVFDAVEAATPSTIALLTLEPDAKKQLVRGLAEAKTSEAMLAYIEQLKQQSFFASVVLVKHEINEQDSNKPFRFQFEAQWIQGGAA